MSRGASSKQLPPELAVIIAADFRFFRRRPERLHHLRLAARAEIIEAAEQVGFIEPASEAEHARVFVAVKLLGPARIERAIGIARDCREVDFDEGTASEAFSRLVAQQPNFALRPAALWSATPSELNRGGVA